MMNSLFNKVLFRKVIRAITIILLIFLFVGCSQDGISYEDISLEELNSFAEEEKYGEILEYIDFYVNSESTDKQELVKHAVELIIDNEIEDEMNELENMLLEQSEKVPDYLKLTILESYNENGRIFDSVDRSIEYYSRVSDENIKDQMCSLISKYDEQKVSSSFINKITKLFEADNIEESKKITEDFLEFSSDDRAYDLLRKIEKYETTLNNYDNLYRDMRNVEDSIDQLGISISEDQLIDLRGYMIKRIEPYEYEIALTEYDYWMGEYPSEEHALLETIETQFNSKGYFDMLVIKDREVEVTLKEEHGSFTQTWDVFREVTREELKSIEEREELVSELDNVLLKQNDTSSEVSAIREEIYLILQDLDVSNESIKEKSIVVQASVLNMRDKPGLSGKVIKSVSENDILKINEVAITDKGYRWYKTEVDGEEGWIAGWYSIDEEELQNLEGRANLQAAYDGHLDNISVTFEDNIDDVIKEMGDNYEEFKGYLGGNLLFYDHLKTSFLIYGEYSENPNGVAGFFYKGDSPMYGVEKDMSLSEVLATLGEPDLQKIWKDMSGEGLISDGSLVLVYYTGSYKVIFEFTDQETLTSITLDEN